MSVKDEILLHPINRSKVQTWSGYSWPCLFFGALWYFQKGIWTWAAVVLVLSILTGGLAWLFFPFFANAQYKKNLIAQGYLNEAEVEEINREKRMEKIITKAADKRNTTIQSAGSLADEIAKLDELRKNGVLTDEEFLIQKKKLLYSV